MKRLLQEYYALSDTVFGVLLLGVELALIFFSASLALTLRTDAARLLELSRELCEWGFGVCILTVLSAILLSAAAHDRKNAGK